MTAKDGVGLIALAITGGVVAGALGWVALLALRRRAIRVQIIAVALTAVVATAAGSLVAASAMFISEHDLTALWVLLAASAVVATLFAWLLGGRIKTGTADLQALAFDLGDEAPASANGALRDGGATRARRPASAELEVLRRTLEETSRRLDESRRKERTLEASRRELVAWVSHDLRTPLAGIRAFAEALEDRVVDDPETMQRYHRTIREEADRIAGLVGDLFELSRIHAGALAIQPEEVDLDDLLSDAIAGVASMARAKGVRVEATIGPVSPRVLLSTPEALRVLRNLLDNAIRHTPADGSVMVTSGVDGGAAFVEVSDSCGGIPADDIDRVFDIAFRGDAARSGDENGGGLGLAIAQGIVHAHDGDIRVQNAGEGCRFVITLPLLVAR